MSRDIKSCRIGDRGFAKSTLAPSGVVEIEGDVFSARAQGPAIEAGQEVVVASADIGGLVVQLVQDDRPPEQFAKFGQPAYDSFGDRANATAAAEAEEQAKRLEDWQRTAKKRQLQIGACFGAAAVWLLNPVLTAAEYSFAMQVIVGVAHFVAAMVWAMIVFRVIDHFVRQFDEEFMSLISFSASLSLACSAFGLAMIGSWGIPMGLCQSFVGAIFGAALIPFLSTFLLSGGGD